MKTVEVCFNYIEFIFQLHSYYKFIVWFFITIYVYLIEEVIGKVSFSPEITSTFNTILQLQIMQFVIQVVSNLRTN